MKRFISLILCAALFACALSSCGGKEQNESKTVMETENFKITEDIFQYYMNLNLTGFYNTNSEYIQYMDFDITKPLRSQPLSEGSEETWFDYFSETTKKSVAEDLLLAEYAKSAGLSLGEGDREEIERNVTDLEAQAKQAGKETGEYIRANLGSLITVDTVRAVYEIHLLAEKGREDINASFNYTDEELGEYLDAHYSNFYTADYLTLTVGNRKDPSDMSAEELEKAFDEAYKTAVRINNSSNDKESFLSGAEEYYRSVYNVVEEKPEGADESVISEDELSSLVYDCVKERAHYKMQDSTDAMIFSDKRVEGEHFIIENRESGSCTLYFILSPLSREDGAAVTLRAIFLSQNKHDDPVADAEKIINEWIGQGKTEEQFTAYAVTYGEDSLKRNGGLAESVGEDEMDPAVAEWCFDPARKEGDFEVLSTEGGVYIVYFKSRAETGWKEQARLAMSGEGYDGKLKELSERHPVTVYGDLIAQIPETVNQ